MLTALFRRATSATAPRVYASTDLGRISPLERRRISRTRVYYVLPRLSRVYASTGFSHVLASWTGGAFFALRVYLGSSVRCLKSCVVPPQRTFAMPLLSSATRAVFGVSGPFLLCRYVRGHGDVRVRRGRGR